MKKVVAGVALLLLLAACSNGSSTPAAAKRIPLAKLPHDVILRGEFALGDLGIKAVVGPTGAITTEKAPPGTSIGAESIRGNLSDCAGAGAFADLVADAPVVVSNDKGQAVGVGKIIYGVGTNTYQGKINQCTFRFIVVGLPHLKFYNVKVAGQKSQRIPAELIQFTRGYVQLSAKR